MPEALESKPKPELFHVGERAVSTHGYRLDLFVEHLQEHLGKDERGQWCKLSCLARTFCGGRDTKKGRILMRRQVSRAFRAMLEKGLFLIIEHAPRGGGNHGEAIAVRLYDANAPADHGAEYAREQYDRMVRRGYIVTANEAKARRILGLDEPPTNRPEAQAGESGTLPGM